MLAWLRIDGRWEGGGRVGEGRRLCNGLKREGQGRGGRRLCNGLRRERERVVCKEFWVDNKKIFVQYILFNAQTFYISSKVMVFLCV